METVVEALVARAVQPDFAHFTTLYQITSYKKRPCVICISDESIIQSRHITFYARNRVGNAERGGSSEIL